MKIQFIEGFIFRQYKDIKTYGIKELFRKFTLLISFLIKIQICFLAFFPCVIIRLISMWIIIRIEKAPSANYGNFVEDLARYCCKKKLKIDQPKKRHLDLFYILPSDKIHNKQLAKMWKRKLNFLSGYILDPINRVNRLIPGWKIHAIESLSANFVRDVDNLIERCELKGFKILDFTAEEEIFGKKMLKKFGLEDNDKFVCLAVRDGAYQLRKIPARFHDWSYHDYRNFDIDNFILAAEELARRGYYVFRMGVVANKSMNSENPKIIDYVNSNLRSDFMDVYLGAKCSFCISTGLGFDQTPYVFSRPIALINLPFGDLRTNSEKYLLLTSHHVLKKEKRRLSLSEIFSHGVAYAYDAKDFLEKGIELKDCTSDEIKDLAIEMVELFEFNKKLSFEEEKLQNTFKSLFASNIKRFKFYKEIENPPNKMHGQIRARFCTKFLRENRDWLR